MFRPSEMKTWARKRFSEIPPNPPLEKGGRGDFGQSHGRPRFLLAWVNKIRAVLMVFLLLTAVTGIVYPLLVTGVAQLVFSEKANGSLLRREGGYAGSELIGQPFDDPKYFWGRLSATPDFPYNSASSSGSNLGPSNPALVEAVKARVEALQKADPGNKSSIPIDLVTSSGSGLDPHISPAGALYQTPRVARARGLSEEQVHDLVDQFREPRQWGFLGEPRVNVLKLNLALEGLSSHRN